MEGVPIPVTALVVPGDTGFGRPGLKDLKIVDRTIQTTVNDEERRFEMDQLLPPGTADGDLYDAALASPVSAVVEGISSAVLVLGAFTAGREEVFSGRPSPDDDEVSRLETAGIVAQTVQALFASLRRKSKAINASGHAGPTPYNAEVFASLVEVFDDDIQDLLDSSKRGLVVREDDRDGTAIAGCTTYGPIPSSEAFLELFHAGYESRGMVPTEYGPRSMYASCVLRIRVRQTIRGAALAGLSMEEQLDSTLLLVNVAGVEKLALEAEMLRMREGPTLNRGILAFQRVANAIKTRSELAAIPYADSKLTQCLTDALGGNSLTSVVVVVRHGCGSVNGTALALSTALSAGSSYPIVNGVGGRGLLRAYRLHIRLLRDQLKDLQANQASTQSKHRDTEKDLLARVNEMQTRVVHVDMQRLRVEEEKERVVKALADLRDSYNGLVEEKLGVQNELISAEEEKLRVSRVLLDVQLEHTQLKEIVDGKQYDMDSKVLRAEGGMVEAEMKLNAQVARAEEAQQKLREIETEKREVEEEMASLRMNLTSRTKELKTERGKSQDLGAEVLTLVNRVAVLEEQLRAGGSVPAAPPTQRSSAPLTSRSSVGDGGGGVGTVSAAVQDQLDDTQADLAAARAEVASLTSELQREAASHREALLQLTEARRSRGVDPSVLEELAQLHSAQEERLADQATRASSRHDDVQVRNKRLVSRCEQLRRRICELTPDSRERKTVEDDIGEHDLSTEKDPLQTTLVELREQVRDRDHRLVMERERAARAVTSLEDSVRSLESEVSEWKAKALSAAAEPRPRTRGSISDALGSARDAGAADKLRQQLADATRDLEAQRHKTSSLRKAKMATEEELANVKAQLRRAQSAAKAASKAVAASSSAPVRIDPTASEDTMLGQLQRSEHRAAGLLSRNTAVEAELATYKAYMKKTLPHQQATISALKKEVKLWKAKAGAL